jgi:hypothetical protein
LTTRADLATFQDTLKAAESRGNITPKGAEVLAAIRQGAWAEEDLGAFLHGLGFSFSDEVLGTARSAISDAPGTIAPALTEFQKGMRGDQQSPLTGSDVGIAQQRQALETFREENPARAITAEIGGTLVPAFIPGMAPTSLLRAAGVGAASGLAHGLGAGEGGAQDRSVSGAIGGTVGLAAGGLGNVIQRPIAAAVRGISKAARGSTGMGKQAARALLREAIEAEGMSMEGALQHVLSKTGKPYTLADIGPNTRSFIDAVNVLPGVGKSRAQKFLAARSSGMVTRLTDDLQKAFGKRGRFLGEFKALVEARSKTGGRLYDMALKSGKVDRQVGLSPKMVEILQRPSVADAFRRAKDIAAEKGDDLGGISVVDGRLLNQAGEEVAELSAKFLHYLKMGLDDQIFTGRSPTSGIGSTQLNALKGTRAIFLDLFDSASPAYKRARNYWAGETSAMDAMKLGRTITRADPDELADDLARMSASETEAFRLGAMNALIDKIEGTVDTANIARNFVKTKKLRRLLRLTFPKGEKGQSKYDKFVDKLSDEMDMHVTNITTTSNSATAARQEAVGRLREAAERSVPQEITGLTQLMHRVLKSDFADASEVHLRSMSDELSRALLETDPAKLRVIMREIGGRRIQDVLTDVAPELLSFIARKVASPVVTGGTAGRIAAEIGPKTFPGTPQLENLLQ